MRVAEMSVILVAAVVVALGGNGVVNVLSEPNPVPTEFCTIAQ